MIFRTFELALINLFPVSVTILFTRELQKTSCFLIFSDGGD